MQMLCALLIFRTPRLDRPLTSISPWLDQTTARVDEVFALLAGQQHRRFIKTHCPFDGLPDDDRVTYLCVGRDPRDVGLSMENHRSNMDVGAMLRARERAVGNDDVDELIPPAWDKPSDDARTRFRAWVDDDTPVDRSTSTLRTTLHHVGTFWTERHRRKIALFHYSDLQRDLVGEMERLAAVLEIAISSDDEIRELAPHATFRAMKQRAGELAPCVDIELWRDNASFFHRGESGQWRDLLDECDLAHYEARVQELATPDLAWWMHHGNGADG